MTDEKIIGLGGVGDCLIIIFKLLERQNQNYTYVHLASSNEKAAMCDELLSNYNIKHEVMVTPSPRIVWEQFVDNFDDSLNVFAEGRITIPKQPHHWEPCIDSGFNKPFEEPETTKVDNKVVVQVNATFHKPPAKGLDNVRCPEGRHYAVRPLVDYVKQTHPEREVFWVGTDTDFECEFGNNKVGLLSMKDVFEEIASASFFVGFNSVLLYWALRNKVNCTLLPDHQGRDDMRIHSEWKNYLNYYDE
jgi:hypothetical protein